MLMENMIGTYIFILNCPTVFVKACVPGKASAYHGGADTLCPSCSDIHRLLFDEVDAFGT